MMAHDVVVGGWTAGKGCVYTAKRYTEVTKLQWRVGRLQATQILSLIANMVIHIDLKMSTNINDIQLISTKFQV